MPPKATVRWGILARARTARRHGEIKIQQFMMRLSHNLRGYRWLVFTGWLLALVPAIYLAMTQSGNLTGGGFEVAGSQSIYVHDQLDDQFHDQGASSLALVAAPRPDASYQDINDAVTQLRQIAAEIPGTAEAPNPTQRPRRSRTGRTCCRCGWIPATPVTSPNSCAKRSGSTATSPARPRMDASG